jgi:hypothetical protein
MKLIGEDIIKVLLLKLQEPYEKPLESTLYWYYFVSDLM